MSRAARTARTRRSPTTPAATGIAPSARARRQSNGWRNARPTCCRCRTFHIVFTLPAPIGDIAYQNKAVIYDILFKAAAETLNHDRRRPQAPRRPHRHHLRAPYLGIGAYPSSARPHDRAGRRHLAGRQAVGIVPAGFFLPVRVLSRLFRRLFLDKLAAAYAAGRLQFFGDHAALAEAQAFAAYLAPLRSRMGRLRQAPVRRTGGRARLSVALHPSRRHRQQPADRARRQPRHLQLEGLSRRGPRTAQGHDTRRRRVHPPLPHPCAARTASTASATTACSPAAPAPTTSRGPANCSTCPRGTTRAPRRLPRADQPQRPPAMPVLRRPHDHHRDLRARLLAAHSSDRTNHHRLLMIIIATRSRNVRLACRCLIGHGASRPNTQCPCQFDRSSSINAAVFARTNPPRHRTRVDSCPRLPARNSRAKSASLKSP